MKPCDDLNVDLLRYLDNDLSEQEFKYLRTHLDTCVYCQNLLQRERTLSRFLHESRPLRSAPAELGVQDSAAIERNSADPKIFEDRFARFRHLLHFLAVRILGSEGDAEDAVRKCGAAASRNPPSFGSEGAFRSWLARILIDEACALFRGNSFP